MPFENRTRTGRLEYQYFSSVHGRVSVKRHIENRTKEAFEQSVESKEINTLGLMWHSGVCVEVKCLIVQPCRRNQASNKKH